MRALGHRLTPALLNDLRAAGLNLERPLNPHYPAAVRVECVRLLREHLFADDTEEQASFALGGAAVEGFLKTIVGHGFGVVFRMLGPRAVMKRSPAVMASASNYVSADTVERGPFRWEVRLEGTDLHPAYYRGMIAAALQICSIDDVQVMLESQSGNQLKFICTWAPPNARVLR